MPSSCLKCNGWEERMTDNTLLKCIYNAICIMQHIVNIYNTLRIYNTHNKTLWTHLQCVIHGYDRDNLNPAYNYDYTARMFIMHHRWMLLAKCYKITYLLSLTWTLKSFNTWCLDSERPILNRFPTIWERAVRTLEEN